MTGSALVVIRGNSGSGKSTLAREVRARMGRGTALIGQDHLRRELMWEHDRPGAANIGLIEHTARYCLGVGYHVVLEGILFTGHYGAMLRGLLGDHCGPRHVYYLDVDFDETVRRHHTRPQAAEFTPEEMADWYCPRDLLEVPGEVVLPQTLCLEEMVERIVGDVGEQGVPPAAGATGAFLDE